MQDGHLDLSGPGRESSGLLTTLLHVIQEEETRHDQDVPQAAQPRPFSSLPYHLLHRAPTVPIITASHTHLARCSATGPLLIQKILSPLHPSGSADP